MRFKVKYPKLGNQFFFVSNLAEWNPYCRQEYNKIWLRNNPLSKQEKETLLEVRQLLKKQDLTPVFFLPKAWQKAGQKLNKKDFEKLQKAFQIFAPRFNKLWSKEKQNLQSVAKHISNTLKVSREILEILQVLYGVSSPPSECSIFLVSSPILKRAVSGGRAIGKNKIILECSKITTKNNNQNFVLRVLLHEMVHASLQTKVLTKIQRYMKNIDVKKKEVLLSSAISKQTKSLARIINEMILVSLLPEGYLAEKFFGLDVLKNLKRRKCIKENKLKRDYYDLMLFSVFCLYPVAKYFCENKKPIDDDFINSAIKCWQEFEKTNLKKICKLIKEG